MSQNSLRLPRNMLIIYVKELYLAHSSNFIGHLDKTIESISTAQTEVSKPPQGKKIKQWNYDKTLSHHGSTNMKRINSSNKIKKLLHFLINKINIWFHISIRFAVNNCPKLLAIVYQGRFRALFNSWCSAKGGISWNQQSCFVLVTLRSRNNWWHHDTKSL